VAFEVIWFNPALRSMQIACESRSKIDPAASVKLEESLFARTDELAQFPYLGSVYERKGKVTRYREVLVDDYRVFYEVNENRQRVAILLIWHTSRDEPTLDDLKAR